MEIFLSWSGEKSLKVANALRDWLPNIIQTIEPWVSETDIKKGDMWMTAISEKLSNTDIGIICVTKENLEKPWLLFEAGALSKSMATVCTLLIDVEPINTKPPLSLFQATIAKNKNDIFNLIKTINDKSGDGKLTEERLGKSFEKWWLDFNAQIESLNIETSEEKEDNEEVETPPRTDRELLEEVLIRLRDLEKQKNEDNKNKNDVYLARKIRAASAAAIAKSVLKDEFFINTYKDINMENNENPGIEDKMRYLENNQNLGIEDKMRYLENNQNLGIEKKKRIRLGKSEAESRVKDLLNSDVEESLIIEFMQDMGISIKWTLDQINILKSKNINSAG